MQPGRLQNVLLQFVGPAAYLLHTWITSYAAVEKIARLDQVLHSVPSQPTVTIKIPSLKHNHAQQLFDDVHVLFPCLEEAGKLSISPTSEYLPGRLYI